MRPWITAGLMSLAAGAAQATCSPNPAEPVAAFEIAKQALLDGEYDLFLRTVLPINQDPLLDRERLVGALERGWPDGLPGCESVAFRSDPPGYYQEVVFFEAGSGPIALYMEAALFRGAIKIMSFNYSDSPADILQSMH